MRRKVQFAATAVILTGALLGYRAWSTRPLSFNPERWASKDDGVRGRVANHMLEAGELHGLERAVVNKMLGPPDEGARCGPTETGYYLGVERGIVRIDGEWLCLSWSNDRVSSSRTKTD